VVRLEVGHPMPDFMLDTLIENLQISKNDVHMSDGPLGLSDVMSLFKLPLHHLKEKPFHPVTPKLFDEEEDFFSIIRQKIFASSSISFICTNNCFIKSCTGS
jgi:polyphosphate kinase